MAEAAKRFKDKDDQAENNSAVLGDYIRSGIVLSDLACEQWLDTLGRADRDVSFAKDVMNIVGNLIIGIAGINGANPGSLARGTLGLAAGNASTDAFKNEVILGALADIEAKLLEGRKITAATIKTNIPVYYDDAKGMLISYHRDCSPNAIKVLLKTSLSAVKYQPADTTLSDAVKKTKAAPIVAELVADMYPGNGAKTLSDEELYKLYLAKIAPISDPAPPFVAKQTADIKALATDFSSANIAQREDKLRKIAELKGFALRYAEEWSVAKRENVHEQAQKVAETAATAQTVVRAAESLPAFEMNKLQSSPEAKVFFSAPYSVPPSKEFVSTLKQSASKVDTKTQKGKDLVEAVRKLEVKQGELETAKKQGAEISAAPPPPVVAHDVRTELGTPVSVNAVLVPTAGQSK